MTDIEGNLDFWARYLDISTVLKRSTSGELLLRDGCAFVFGGDLFDKGPGDIRLSKELVALKQRYPDRVALLMGNRDVNKLRFHKELGERAISGVPLSALPGPFWSRRNQDKTPQVFLEQMIGTTAPVNGGGMAVSRLQKLNTRLNRLYWMLQETLGCAGTFEHRRRELGEMSARAPENVSDQEVLESFVRAIEPGGCYWEYLMHADVAAKFGDTLFVHGSAQPKALGFVPSIDMNYDRSNSDEDLLGTRLSPGHPLALWVSRLNAWKNDALDEFAAVGQRGESVPPRRTEPGPSWWWGEPRAASSLLCYQSSPCYLKNDVMVSSFIEMGSPSPIPRSVSNYLKAGGIHRVVAGHKPIGESPLVVVADEIEHIFADTSYSDSSAPDRRGCCVSEVAITTLPGASQTHIQGLVATGERINFCMPPKGPRARVALTDGLLSPGDSFVGRVGNDGWRVRAKLASGSTPVYALAKRERGTRKVEKRRESIDSLVCEFGLSLK